LFAFSFSETKMLASTASGSATFLKAEIAHLGLLNYKIRPWINVKLGFP